MDLRHHCSAHAGRPVRSGSQKDIKMILK